MPRGKSVVILFFGVLGLALFLQTRAVEAQSCPAPPPPAPVSCDCGDPVCDENGNNCTCPDLPTCDCGSAFCSGGQYQCSTAPACDPSECTELVCVATGWTCESDASICDAGAAVAAAVGAIHVIPVVTSLPRNAMPINSGNKE
jgi:hypothetical protein